MIKKKDLSLVDKETWQDYIKNPSDIYDKESKSQDKDNRRERFKYDLHGFSLNEANKKVKEIIFFCKENRYKELLLITGKGLHSTNYKDTYASKDLGKLKYSVPDFIKSDPELNKLIISIKEAETKDGGEGEIIIKYKKL